MREIFVSKLVAEVLGPSNLKEKIQESPASQYITGVLQPIFEKTVEDKNAVDSEAEIPYDEIERIEEDASNERDISASFFASPTLNPKNRPSSFGLSFLVKSQNPKVRVCVTWSRYYKKGYEWIRSPRLALRDCTLTSERKYFFDENGEAVSSDIAEVSLHVIPEQINYAKNMYMVSVYLVNQIKPDKDELDPAECVYQPQIRIVCDTGTRLEPMEMKTTNEEEQTLDFIYREKPVFGRGHFCSVTWKGIDPESEPRLKVKPDFEECLSKPPFFWIDGQLLEPKIRKIFSSPDIRTEFIPLYQILSPAFDLPESNIPKPELRASKLAELFNPKELETALSPIADGYEAWLNRIEKENPGNSGASEKIKKAIEQCRKISNRIKSGIGFLSKNEDARLAFCFANRAIGLQHSWKDKENPEFEWYPFQLAFILMSLESIANHKSEYRDYCDVLWIPTGGGKTEAYLGIIAFTISFRRRLALTNRGGSFDRRDGGVSVITRYTLRLLTIQQFRRALALVTACEYLRVDGLEKRSLVGWRPSSSGNADSFIWGSVPFGIGLWVGQGVTPNKLKPSGYSKNGRFIQTEPGAINILKDQSHREYHKGEPAQILNCPACKEMLAVPDEGLPEGQHIINFVIKSSASKDGLSRIRLESIPIIPSHRFLINEIEVIPHKEQGFFTLSIGFDVSKGGKLLPKDLNEYWNLFKNYAKRDYSITIEDQFAKASRPGYFLRYCINKMKNKDEYDFDIYCPNPQCELNRPWCGGLPSGSVHAGSKWAESVGVDAKLQLPDNNRFIMIQEPFRDKESKVISIKIPINASTVDDQIYSKLPTIVIATVDKFARLAFEPRTAAIFGNVNSHHPVLGYNRTILTEPTTETINVPPPLPPELIIQDELHLIDGPLGSMVGLYETAIDYLCSETGVIPKYIASTATVRNAEEQVQSTFARKYSIFPFAVNNVGERYFVTDADVHPLDDSHAGRLYMGICAPGRGPHTPITRIWARLIHTTDENALISDRIDPFWTLTGYFNSKRELAGTEALYRDDIQQRLDKLSPRGTTQILEPPKVLSSRTDSWELPGILDELEKPAPDSPRALLTTSMFGTGIDIRRLGLMFVNGQPKTTSAYIQSTGRVGRKRGALIVTFYRASRPRDLDHYEFFCRYHCQLHRFVEPVSVFPFSPGAIDKAVGPVCVSLLRNMRQVTYDWSLRGNAVIMKDARHSLEVKNLPLIFNRKAEIQPISRKPIDDLDLVTKSALDQWQSSAARLGESLRYEDYSDTYSVVLGDPKHEYSTSLQRVYKNAPQSLRDIEDDTTFQIDG